MAKPLVLFVHGLGGNSEGTWGKFPTLIANDPDIGKRVDVAFYDYPTRLVSFSFLLSSLKIQELAQAIKTAIDVQYADRAEIVLVCHSMGGIVCQKYLIDEYNAERIIRVKAVALYAPPTFGSKLAKLGAILSWKHRHLIQLVGRSDLLQNIREHWPRLTGKLGIQSAHIVGGQDKVVIRSEVPDADVHLVADRGHSNIVKPNLPEDLAFLILKQLLQKTVVKRRYGEDTRPAVLFDIYQPIFEPFYLKRREDEVLGAHMKWKNVWVFGPSGFGKTAALMRALFLSDVEYRFLSLGHYLGSPIKALMAAIANDLDQSPLDAKVSPTLDWPELTLAVVQQLEAASVNGNKWILIEELPLQTQSDFAEFFSRLSNNPEAQEEVLFAVKLLIISAQDHSYAEQYIDMRIANSGMGIDDYDYFATGFIALSAIQKANLTRNLKLEPVVKLLLQEHAFRQNVAYCWLSHIEIDRQIQLRNIEKATEVARDVLVLVEALNGQSPDMNPLNVQMKKRATDHLKSQETTVRIVNRYKNIGRNTWVKVQYADGKIVRDKFKVVQRDLVLQNCRLLED